MNNNPTGIIPEVQALLDELLYSKYSIAHKALTEFSKQENKRLIDKDKEWQSIIRDYDAEKEKHVECIANLSIRINELSAELSKIQYFPVKIDKFIVVQTIGEDLEQISVPLDTYERAEEFKNSSTNKEYYPDAYILATLKSI